MLGSDAFEQLYRKHVGLVRGVIFQIAGGEALDDLVQEAFIKIWRGVERFEHRAQLKTWIYRVACNVALDWRRRPKYINILARLLTVFQTQSVASSEATTHQRLWLVNGLQKLDSPERMLLTLTYLQDLRQHEIAAILEVPVGTVKSRLHHAKRALKHALEQSEIQPESAMVKPLKVGGGYEG